MRLAVTTSLRRLIWEVSNICIYQEGLIGKPEQPEINFIKVERNDEVEQKNDAVNHPSHYTYGGIECIDAIHAVVNEIPNGICAWLTGQVIKYIWRWMHKDKPVEDLKKCRFYLDRLIENVEVVYGGEKK